MLRLLMDAMRQAQNEGYEGLWASGDMTWELGSEKNFAKLFDYECQLEETLRQNPMLSGICQYHTDTIPAEMTKDALYTHEAVYINGTLTRMNPYYLSSEDRGRRRTNTSATDLKVMLERLQGE